MKPSSIKAVKALRDSAAEGRHADYLTAEEQRRLVAACDKNLAKQDGQVKRRRKGRQ